MFTEINFEPSLRFSKIVLDGPEVIQAKELFIKSCKLSFVLIKFSGILTS